MTPRIAIGTWVAAALVAAAPSVSAQILAQVVPVKYNLTVRTGEVASRDIAVANLGDEPVVVRVRLSDWTVNEAGELSLAPAGTYPASLHGLLTFEPAEFSLGPGETGRVHVSLRLPADGPPTRWGVVLSEVRPAVPRPASMGPRAIAELGTTFYVSRIPADQIRAELTALHVTPLGDDSLAVSVRIRNAGERHVHVGGEVAIADSVGARMEAGRLPTGVVLPGTQREFTWTCRSGLRPGHYTATATLDTGEPTLMVGETGFAWPLPWPVDPRTLAGDTDTPR
jgi:P pilus assembly chaperone PapD